MHLMEHKNDLLHRNGPNFLELFRVLQWVAKRMKFDLSCTFKNSTHFKPIVKVHRTHKILEVGGGLGHVIIVYSWQAVCDVSYLCPGLIQCHMEGQDTLLGCEWSHQVVSLML